MARRQVQFIPQTGFKELDAMLRELPKNVAGKVARSALRASMKMVADESRATVPVASGDYKASIKVRAGKRKRGQIWFFARSGGKGGKSLVKVSKRGRRSFYPAAVEYGVKGTRRRPGEHLLDAARRAGPQAQRHALSLMMRGTLEQINKYKIRAR